MSSECVGWVYRHSPYTGATLQVHLAVADSVNDQNSHEFWLPLRRLAAKSRISVSTAHEAIATMVADGLLMEIIPAQQGRGKAGHYRFLFPELPPVYDSRNVRSPNISGDRNVRSADRNVRWAPSESEPGLYALKQPKGTQKPAGAPAREGRSSLPAAENQTAFPFGNPKGQPQNPTPQRGAVLPLSTPERRAALEAIPTTTPAARRVAPGALAGIRSLKSVLRPDRKEP